MARRSKVVFCLLLAFLYVVVNICPLRAEALPDVMSGSTTLADNIMTYYALSGSAVANTDWINTLYDSYGTSFGTIEELANQGYLVLNDAGMWEPVQELGQMIEQAPAYSSLGLNEMFNVSAEEVAAGGGLAVASGGSILAGSLGGVASTGVLTLFGGVTAAYWGGIGLGTLIAHKLGLYGENIYQGTAITFNEAMSNIPPDAISVKGFRTYRNVRYDKYLFARGIPFSYVGSNSYNIGIANLSDNTVNYYTFEINRSNGSIVNSASGDIAANFYNTRGIPSSQTPLGYDKINFFNSFEEFNNALNGWKDGSITPEKQRSPDMIGENGNLTGTYNNQNGYQVPDMKPQIDPQTQAGKPLTLQDWLNFANSVKNNNSSADPFGNNADIFGDILDAIRVANPNGNPDPNPDPDPWSPPVVTPVPDPSYPDPVPDQQLTENPQESENPQQTEPLNPTDTGKPWKLPDLRQKFPFCIPWDISKIFSKLKVNTRQAPHISWRFNPPNTPIDYTFNLDLEDFEGVASLLRTLELMGFIVGLAFATRYLIGAN